MADCAIVLFADATFCLHVCLFLQGRLPADGDSEYTEETVMSDTSEGDEMMIDDGKGGMKRAGVRSVFYETFNKKLSRTAGPN